MKKILMTICALLAISALTSCGNVLENALGDIAKDLENYVENDLVGALDNIVDSADSILADIGDSLAEEPPVEGDEYIGMSGSDQLSLSKCLAGFGVKRSDIVLSSDANVKSEVLKSHLFRGNVVVNQAPDAAAIQTYYESVYAAFQKISDDGKLYLYYDLEDPLNPLPTIEYTLADVDFAANFINISWSYNINGQRRYIKLGYAAVENDSMTHSIEIKESLT